MLIGILEPEESFEVRAHHLMAAMTHRATMGYNEYPLQQIMSVVR
jgi:hypothetical protein